MLLLPNKPPPEVLFALPKMLLPVFVVEPKPENAEGKLDMFELRGAELADRCAVLTVARGRAEPPEKNKMCAYLQSSCWLCCLTRSRQRCCC